MIPSNYKGPERRVTSKESIIECSLNIIKVEGKIDLLTEKILNLDKRINGSLDRIGEHIKSDNNWRLALLGIAATVVINIVVFAFGYGSLTSRVAHAENVLNSSKTFVAEVK
jgi:hypothetical protein